MIPELTILTKRVAELEKTVARLRGKQETWIKVSDVVRLTGWDKERLRRARLNGEIKFKDDNGRFYLLESISTIHLKQSA